MGVASGTRRALVVLLAAGSLVVMAGAVVAPVLPLIRDRFGLGADVAGLVITAHALMIAVFGPVVGALIDRWGTRPVLICGLVAYAVFGGAGALATSFPLLLGSRMLFGVAAAAVLNGGTVAMLNLWQNRDRDRVMGYWATANSFGGVVWPVVAGLLGALGWHGPFIVYLIGLPIAAAAIRLLPESVPGRRAAGRRGRDSGAPSMRAVLRSTPVLPWLYALVFVVQLQLYSIIVFVPQRLAELGVGRPLLVSAAVALVNLAAGVVGLNYARLRRTLSFWRLFLLGCGCAVLAFAVLSAAGTVWLVLIGTPLFGLGLPITLASAPALLGRQHIPAGVRGRAAAYQSSMMLLGQFSAPLLLGLLVAPFGIRTAFVGALVVGVAEIIAVAVAFHPVEKPVEKPTGNADQGPAVDAAPRSRTESTR